MFRAGGETPVSEKGGAAGDFGSDSRGGRKKKPAAPASEEEGGSELDYDESEPSAGDGKRRGGKAAKVLLCLRASI